MTNNKEQTAVEWLFNEFQMINSKYRFESIEYFKARQEAFEIAIKMYNKPTEEVSNE